MKIKILLQRSKKYKEELKYIAKKDLTMFAKEQFLQLTKKNIQIPVKLYHL